ncbi:MAG: RidA family protein [Hafnia sp.]|uniref:RidA family protein n=1 Tax=Obesumbacterium proteus TaxID=82983 RepID=UPI001F2F6623|nr:RidA family protein [Obesumbacterium proteus]MCE9883853.1 RidA family protein [Obesumbacterium proteus]MCE9918147.1 RidA family protein [Obesumbacterium proteus]MCE9931392.1 RidA family protein [Obesumbacterium proteus]MCG2878323.1 RidA family protein [Obesumbacterium proteus]
MKIIHSDRLPTPGGHYSPAIISGNSLYISGQLPISLTSPRPQGELAEQAQTVFNNIDILLDTVGINKRHLVNVQVYLSDVALWPEFNRLYAQWIGDHRPARTVVPCSALHYGALLEMSAIAEIALG